MLKIANELGILRSDLYWFLNKNGYKTFGEFVDSNNHQIVSIEKANVEDAYDLVNTGKEHIYALETLDGGLVYTHNSTTKDEFEDVLTISTDNKDIENILQN